MTICDVLLFGSYNGQVAVADAATGRYRVKVDADGSWTLRFQQPVPTGNAKNIPGVIKGRGAMVVPLRSTEDLQPIVTGRHRGQANFIVYVTSAPPIDAATASRERGAAPRS